MTVVRPPSWLERTPASTVSNSPTAWVDLDKPKPIPFGFRAPPPPGKPKRTRKKKTP